ncbi:MAG TPA: histone deacetylase family protein [Gammaproteobacteria bacterium]|nr:histone deacetylase family protein [Gammaproteobacteria bacterium]
MPGNHPEAPARLDAIEKALEAGGWGARLLREQAAPADFAQLQRVHATEYLRTLQSASPAAGYHALDPDTFMNQHTFEAALLAAGAGILGVDRIMQGRAASAFCAVRPPGHHARRAQAMGFCLINNIAVAAMHALEHYNLRRVAILDFDVHHGNGTQDIFINEQRVLFCSTHQHPFYPYTGEPVTAAHVINARLTAGSGSLEFRQAVLQEWMPALEGFKPDFIFVSAGFDAHVDDPLGGLRFTEADYGWIGAWIRGFAKVHCGGRVLSMLEGGYNVPALARSVMAYIQAFED